MTLGISIAITGNGQQQGMWLTHAMTRFPHATIYDRTPKVRAFLHSEVRLGKQGYLDPAGRAAAERIAHRLANPPDVDAILTFVGPFQNGTVKVKCKNGTETLFHVRLNSIEDAEIQQAFFHVDTAITLCKFKR